MLRTTMVSLAVTAALALAACGDDQEPAAQTSVAATGDTQRYCALGQQLDKAGTKFFAKLEADESAGQEDYEKAERAFVAKYAPQFAEIEAVAPAEVRTEVRTVLTAQRERAGLVSTETPEAAVAEAEKTVRAFEEQACE